MHCHPINILSMTFVHDLDEKAFTKTLWRTITECMVVFPDGLGVLPWMLCGTNEIGEATAEKMKDFRMVVWAQHGIYGAGRDLDETFGLIETWAILFVLKFCLWHVDIRIDRTFHIERIC